VRVTGENCKRISLGAIKFFWPVNILTVRGLSGYEQLVLDFNHGGKRLENTGLIIFLLVKKFPHILWKLNVHYRVHNSRPLLPILSQINPVYVLTSYQHTFSYYPPIYV
jgi:hypothetical protein